MTAYEIQDTLENIDPLVVLGGLSLLFGFRQGYKSVTSFDRKKGNEKVSVNNPDGTPALTPKGGRRYRNDYRPNLALRKQKPGFYLSGLAALAGIMFGTAALYEGITKSYL